MAQIPPAPNKYDRELARLKDDLQRFYPDTDAQNRRIIHQPIQLAQRAVVIANASEDAAWRAFLRAETLRPNANADWVGGWQLGTGAHARTGVWVRVAGATGSVQERMVIKEVDCAPATVPREVAVHTRLRSPQSLQQSRHLVELISHAPDLRDPANPRYRLYLEFCPHGDLMDLMVDQYGKGRNRFLFESLVQAARDLETAVPGDVVVHGDLKPENVFLSDPDPNSWRLYPTIKMADFDGSRITNAADPGNPGAFWGDAMTDGMIMYASLTLRSPVQPLIHPSRTWGNVLDNRRVYDIDPDNRYTQELKNQIRDCLRYNPAYRPTAQDLLIDFALHRGGERGAWIRPQAGY
ncbi:hypothetical protein H2203_008078 [Taxawa tesnikishii (nom. ined.)]|nr:hypothetical protein H2203_008078 [Dothideales sp. JES 119]